MKEKLKYVLLVMMVFVLNGGFAQNDPFCTIDCQEGQAIHQDLSGFLEELPNSFVEVQWWTTEDKQLGTQVTPPFVVTEPGDYYAFYYDPINDCYNQDVSTAFIRINGCSVINLWKSGQYVDTNNDGLVNIGDVVEYSFTVSNNGNLTVSDITVSDDMVTVNGGPISLAPGQTDNTTFTATYAITQADIDAGGVWNLAIANGNDPYNIPVDPVDSEDPNGPLDPTDPNYDPACPDCTFTELEQEPGIDLTKSGLYVDFNNDGEVNVGDVIDYTFVVTNTGNTTLTDVVVTDPLLGNDPVFGPANLNVGESATFTVTYEITQDDINNGGVYNIALATGNDPNDDPVTDDSNDPNPLDPTDPNYDPACPDCTFTELEQESGIDLTKSGLYVDFDNDGNVNVGDVIEYTFTVTNTGNTTLTDVVVTDPLLGNDPLFGPATLDAGESSTFTVTYGITQSDIDNGGVYNIALATGNDSNDDPVTVDSNDPNPLDPTDPNYDPACPDCTFTELEQESGIDLTKSGLYVDFNNDGEVNVGDVIDYTFVVTNTGNTTLTDVVVTDPLLGNDPVFGPANLNVGESATFTVTYEITQSDIDNGGVYNIALATGNDPNDDPVTDDSNDPNPLDPTDPNYDPACPDCTFTELEQESGIDLTKSGLYVDFDNDGNVNVGDVIDYTFVVTNTGNTTLTDVVVTDQLLGNDPVFGPANLNVGESATFTVTYEITQDDINNGGVYNIALATGNDPNDDPVTDDSNDPNPLDPTDPNYDPACPDCTFTELEQESGIDLTKSGLYVDFDNDGNVNVGDVIEYTFTVTNTGNTTLTDVVVTDPLLGNDPVFGPANLNVGESATFTVTYEITQDDINNGGVYNIALATGNDPNDDPVTDDSNDPNPLDPTDPNYDPACPDCTFTELEQESGIDLTKSGLYVDFNNDGNVNVGDVIDYTFVVTNTGNTTLTDVVVTDPLLGNDPVFGPANLDVGESATFTVSYEITQDDINNGGVYNIALASGNDPNDDPVTDDSNDPNPLDPTDPNYDPACPDCTFTELDANPELTLWKSGVYVDENGDGKLNIGDVVEYTFVVENTGNTTITDIYVTDPMVTVNGGPITLAPGEVDSTTFTATYYLTHADIYEGVVYNLATVEGEDPSGTPVYDDSQDPDPLDPTSPYYDEDCPDCTVTPLPKDDFEIIKVPNAFTPDGDGQNDTWVIEGIELYPNSVLIVYNRWGNIVYEATGYLNDWNGTSNNNLNVGGNELPTGTYYYVLDTKEDKPGVIKGFVYIQR